MRKNKPDFVLKQMLLIIFAASIVSGALFVAGKLLLGAIFLLGSILVLGVFLWDWREIHDPHARARIKSTDPHPQYKSFVRFSTAMVVFGGVLMAAFFASDAYLAGIACGIIAAAYVAAIARG